MTDPDEMHDEDEEVLDADLGVEEPAPTSFEKLMQFAQTEGDISELLTAQQLSTLGAKVVEDYDRDDASREDWKQKAQKSLDRAAQEKIEAKDYPWKNASNVSYPLLTVAALQFAARAYPAIVKNDEAVMVKVFGTPPVMTDDAKAAMQALQHPEIPPEAAQQAQQVVQQSQDAIKRFKGKKERAKRVASYLNYQIFYEMDGWESDTDTLLHQLPIVGCGFRKVWHDQDTGKSNEAYVPALRLVVNQDVRSLESAPRVTEEIPDVYPYQIASRMASGQYREIVLPVTGDDDQEPRMLLEQHRLEDLDDDGVAEPYVVTVDHESRQVLRIEPAFSEKTVRMNMETGKVIGFKRFMPYQKFGFIPDLKGRFYDIGFGHLLDQISDVVNTSINELIDAGHAAVAGGGFISSGLRLQGNGQTNVMRWRPGEYKVVNHPDPQKAIWERTFPQPSPVVFQLLDMMLGAAKDITSTKDVVTGEAPTNAPVGTTLAMIEQGLQVFVAIYKRVYRSLKGEFKMLYDCIANYGDPEDYANVLDDPAANFAEDFGQEGKDIVPVSDPSAATKMQSMAKAQMLLGLTGKGLNDQEIYLRALTAFDIDDPEELVNKPAAPENPLVPLQAKELESKIVKNEAQAMNYHADAMTKHRGPAFDPRGLSPMESASGQPVGVQGVPGPDGGPAPGMDAAVMG